VTVSSKLTTYVFGVILALILIAKALTMWTDFLWFGAMGQAEVFTTILSTRMVLGIVVGVLFFAWLWANLRFARKPLPDNITLIGKRLLPDEERAQVEQYADKALLVFALIGGLMAGLVASGKWLQWLQYTHAVDFGQTDPLFGKDAGFYVFKLAFLQYAFRSVFYAVVIAAITSTLVHLYQEAIRIVGNTVQATSRARYHILGLVSLALLVKVWGYRLGQLALLVGDRGQVLSGATYSDVHGRIPMAYGLMALCLMAAIVIVANARSRKLFVPAGALAVVLLVSLLGGAGYPTLLQKLVVQPTELQKERPYIEHNITATNTAYDLDDVDTELHRVDGVLTWEDVQKNRLTVDNIRLWDHRPLERTMDQIQALRAYYDFPDVDVDRYTINGRVRQVMLSPRQVDSAKIPGTETWVKTNLQYTHGFGVAASPVNEIRKGSSDEGLPNFWVKNIPPESVPGMEIDQPRIYYYTSIRPRLIELIQSIRRHELLGDREQPQTPSDDSTGQPPQTPDRPGAAAQRIMDEPVAVIEPYVVVNTKEEELDYTRLVGDVEEKVSNRYDGRGGVPVGGLMRRIAFAARFQDWKLLFTQSLTRDSRVLINRTVPERIAALCPYFLICDPDPYITIQKGRLEWIIDAYTYSRMYPYSKPHRDIAVNYIRNSIKVRCDAYDGVPEFYVIDRDDPMVQCYQRIFPNLFKKEPMPEKMRDHLRYPALLFTVQAQIYADYHMLDPQTFYQREDSWSIPNELYASEPRPTEAYYAVMKLPGEEKEEFILMLPFTLKGREDRNMVAWMAARCDGDHYGQLLCYKMQAGLLVDGPMMIESRIGQNREFSEKQTLWSQKGSNIIRGNLLVIPIANDLLYVEPVYIASTASAIPELKMVAVATGNPARVGLGVDLDDALANLFGKTTQEVAEGLGRVEPAATTEGEAAPPVSAATPPAAVVDLLNQAITLQSEKQKALAEGDLGGFQTLDRQQSELIEKAREAAE